MPLPLQDQILSIDTARHGPFTFQIGVDGADVETMLLRINDAQQRFRGSPLAQVANQLEKEVVVSSIFGTNSIEGGTLTEEETRQAVELNPSQLQDTEQRRAHNLNQAYKLSQRAANTPGWLLDVAFVRNIHAVITDGLADEYNQPGLLRDNAKGIVTHVGDQAHGGRYKPPQFGGDVALLLEQLVHWHQQLVDAEVPVLIRAPLLHYYFELIHPFWDGNGRVGRVLEATLLQAEGYLYAPFAQARYYFEHIDQYFSLFNHCRKQAEKQIDNPNSDFVQFFLAGMLSSIHKLHDRVNNLVNVLLFENELKRRHDEKEINSRQYAIVSQIMQAGTMSLSELRRAPWYLALYTRLTDKTKQRDLAQLKTEGLINQDKDNRLWPGCIGPV
ncbi:MAG: Fic family protein [Gammaproteobacteria bacterium]|nr:Fic family protein [Gammaproteobacteria bacterium]